jgi:predicted transcriptional regulator
LLKRHIAADQQMTPDQYQAKWNLPTSFPMIAPEYAAERSKLAKTSGLGRKVEAPPPYKLSKKTGLGRKVEATPPPKHRGPKKG